ncbi:hypothetical protein C479_13163 [Halovivax asiaticus JCM 14624]|uniref:CDP-archaeol synthase n=1 Tax=Halovivax asiaticus JCM 14624 TaxID=1227490 RepID=M0BBU0_9EURY|nr:CDP-2,3-bis-(O-geranylgeranyl)-sn-glycerol synthase [Halovivax asiaticus]ELZ08290.1 hypothetical protein C479_13163 [Halovivax asiaticus JCM 14624]
MGVLSTIVVAFWLMLPAYVPNNAAVLAGGGRPIDGGRMLGGSRLLGDGKSWRGTAVGTAVGAGLAFALNAVSGEVGSAIGIALPTFPVAVAIALPLGAMCGDIAASFLKRRTGRRRGAPFPVVDQLDFVVLALAFAYVVAPGWFRDEYTLGVLAVILVLTPILHVGTNVLAYWFGFKDEPW